MRGLPSFRLTDPMIHPSIFWRAGLCLGLVLGILGCVRKEPAPAIETATVSASEATSRAPAEAAHLSPSTKTERTAEWCTANQKRKREVLDEAFDPSNDGWETEVLSERATTTLKRIFASRPGLAAAESIPFEVPPRGKMHTVATGPQIVVRRAAADVVDYTSLSNVVALAAWLLEDLPGAQTIRWKVKVFEIERSGDAMESRAYVQWSGPFDDGHFQRNATVRAGWSLASGEIQLTHLRIEKYEEKEVPKSGLWFKDATQRVAGGTQAYREQLSRGANYWIERIEERHGIHDAGRNGLAVGDANGDGRDDLYVCQTGGLPNRLFLQEPDGRLRDHSHTAGVDWLDACSSALFLDIDNDGDQDLVCAIAFRVVVMTNDGDARFQVAAQLEVADEDVKSLCAADFDQDGDIDLYVCVDMAHYGARADEPRVPFTYHDANDGGRNILFANLWSERKQVAFIDVTEAVGLDVHNRRHSLAASWEDFDNDGDQDLYVANDYGKNCLYANDGGRFREVAESMGVLDSASGMSVSWGDMNLDGRMDLYVANMWSSAGGRITNQPEFLSRQPDKHEVYRRFAKGNTLFANQGGGFEDVGARAGVQMGRWAWSSLFADLNNDCLQDLVVANGYLTTPHSGDL